MSLFPSVNSPQRLGTSPSAQSNAKVPLRAGFSLMDWVRLSKSGKDLRGIGTARMIKVTPEELQKHNRRDDAWMAIRGFVYNVTAYMDYHPGGVKELMRGAGKDGTHLFEEVHRWVNFESMLSACLVGRLEDPLGVSKTAAQAPQNSSLLAPQTSAAYKGLAALPKAPVFNGPASDDGAPQIVVSVAPETARLAARTEPTTSWHQSEECVTVACYTKLKSLDDRTGVVCDVEEGGRRLRAEILTPERCISFDISLSRAVQERVSVLLHRKVGKVEIKMHKVARGEQWRAIGKYGDKHCAVVERKSAPLRYRPCRLAKKTPVTHDTSLYRFQLPPTSYMCVPIGFHVYFEAEVEGVVVTRPYTVVTQDLLSDKDMECPPDGRSFHVMIKAYQHGALTPVVDCLDVGQEISVSNCEGSFDLNALASASRVVLLAAGTGFTPMVRVIRHCLNRDDRTGVHLEFFNKTYGDIPWRGELDQLAEQSAGRFTVEHVLSQADDSWPGKRGRVTISLLKDVLQVSDGAGPKDGVFACVCGPTAFTELTVKFMRDLGVKAESIHAFLS